MHSRRSLLVVLGCLGGLASFSQGRTEELDDVKTYQGRVVHGIEWMGLVHTSAQAIQQSLKTADRAYPVVQVGKKLEPRSLSEEISLLANEGSFSYAEARVREREDHSIDVIYVVREYPIVQSFRIVGNHSVEEEDLFKVTRLQFGGFFTPASAQEQIEKVKELYGQKGYPFVGVRWNIKDLPGNAVEATLVLQEYPKPMVRHIHVVGNNVFSADEIRRNLSIQEGTLKGWWSSMQGAYNPQTGGRELQASWGEAFQTAKWVGQYQQQVLQQDAQKLILLYADRGYLDAVVEDPEVVLSPDGKNLDITFRIHEGQPYLIKEIQYLRDQEDPHSKEVVFSQEKLQQLLPFRIGEPYRRVQVAQQLQRAGWALGEEGHSYAKFQDHSELVAKEHQVMLKIHTSIGPLVYIGRIEIKGNRKTNDRVIRREFPFMEGHVFHGRKLKEALARVKQLGFFEHVDFSIEKMEGLPRGLEPVERVAITIQVKERNTLQAQGSIGYSTIEGLNGLFQMGDVNFLGTGSSLLLNGSFSALLGSVSLDVLDPRVRDSKWMVGGSVQYNYFNYPFFWRHVVGGALTVGYQLPQHFQIQLTYQPQWVRVLPSLDRTQASLLPYLRTLPNLYQDFWRTSVRLLLAYDTRDDRWFPRKGMYHTASIEVVDRYVGATVDFVKVDASARFYRPIWGPFWFRANVGVQWIGSRDPQGVPISERIFLGGIPGTRGYSWFQVGPRAGLAAGIDPNAPAIGVPVGGNLSAWGIVEGEFPLIPPRWDILKLRGLAFLEAGNAYNLETQYCAFNQLSNLPEVYNPCATPSITNLRYSAGFGLRWYSPLGLLGFDWGFPLNPQPGESPVVFGLRFGGSI